jgi:hypothetical protein
MKLTIENYKKIESHFNWATWGVQKVEETNTQYHFELRNSYGRILDIQLERIPVSGNETTAYQYEFWCWGHGNSNPTHQTPIREFLYYVQIKDKKLFSLAMSAMIKKWTNG